MGESFESHPISDLAKVFLFIVKEYINIVNILRNTSRRLSWRTLT
jgi:hypothetical protein